MSAGESALQLIKHWVHVREHFPNVPTHRICVAETCAVLQKFRNFLMAFNFHFPELSAVNPVDLIGANYQRRQV